MALAQLLQPWADECLHDGVGAMKSQGGGQYLPGKVLVHRESSEWRGVRARLVRPNVIAVIDSRGHRPVLGWSRIVNSSGIPQ